MRAVDLIEKKRNKEELSKEEISFLLREYLKGNVLSDVIVSYGNLL